MTSFRFFWKYLSVWLAVFLCAPACGVFEKKPRPSTPAFTEILYLVPSDEYPVFDDDMGYDGLSHGILQSLQYLKKSPEGRTFAFGQDVYSKTTLMRSLEMFDSFIQQNPSREQLATFIRSNYLVYRSVGDRETGNVLFTGYYEPFLTGGMEPSDRYPYPVYTLPDDLIYVDLPLFADRFKEEKKLIGRMKTARDVVPYYTRKEIHRDPDFKEKARPLAWVSDRIDLFFLEVQGSGKIYLDDGRVLDVHYRESNGQPYRSIGALLIQQGKIPREEISMQSIKAYLRAHPDEIEDILTYNPSLVFFQLESDGPIGCLGVKLTPGRSLALQRGIFPHAALAFIETSKPLVDGNKQIQAWVKLNRFALVQDTGGAIRGPGRADLFWGNGDYAEVAAGHMQHVGDIYFLVLKPGL